MDHSIKPAGFRLRFLAHLNEWMLEMLPHTLFWLYISNSQSLNLFVYNLVLYLIVWLLPSILLTTLVYYPWTTVHLQGNLGKLITGLKVTDQNNKPLTYKRSLFRHTIGYTFSSILFSLGFLSIIKDPQKLGWHDKAVGSKVSISANRWPLALIVLIFLFVLNGFLVSSSFNKFLNGPLMNEIAALVGSYQEANKSDVDTQTPSDKVSQEFYDLQGEVYALIEQKNYATAKEKAQLLLNNPKNDLEEATALRVLGEVESVLGNNQAAKEYWLESLKINPEDEYTNSQLANLLYNHKNYQQALSYAQKAVELNPTEADYHNTLANILFGLYRDDEALAEIKEAIRLDPTNQLYKNNLNVIESN